MKTCPTLLLGPLAASAQSLAPAPLSDPWLPPAARSASLAPAKQGAALQAQAQAKLLKQFQAADSLGRQALTVDEARRAGFGFAVRNFEQIDSERRGEIRIQDLQRFLALQAAREAAKQEIQR
ncbi:EF-hand domain-containing protein [Pelomonas sp. SE-A7]|uniref:EF-hand domain-containing protein n=1 Tax=Pelomonas sp. SE-A7 TaxID=3054953 RepID=UPI00259D1093|nr:EF-hand domain-containing protein [Pelomonas sp. SE-A7]MDM4767860.1 EF-hand domain-containing protein [Pelomonas sp. SE-A7]